MKRVMLLACFLLVACTSVPIEKQCSLDSDCVKAECCHATDVINKDYGPDCTAILCSQECSGPLDCGEGVPACVRGECVIK